MIPSLTAGRIGVNMDSAMVSQNSKAHHRQHVTIPSHKDRLAIASVLPILGLFCGENPMSKSKRIPLSTGEYATVDVPDYEYLSRFRWSVVRSAHTTYAYRKPARNGRASRPTIYMHREIMGVLQGMQVDHINHDGLDNRRSNLRVCDASQNMANARKPVGTSLYRGVSWDKRSGLWLAQICVNGRKRNLGRFGDEKQAAHAYNEAAIEGFGSFAILNLSQEGQVV